MKTYLFDFDGTLGDTVPHWGRVLSAIAGREIPKGDLKHIMPLGVKGTAAYFIEHYQLSGDADEMAQAFTKSIYLAYAQEVPLKENAMAYLKKLQAARHKMYIFTGSPHITADVAIKRLGLWEMMEAVVATDDLKLSKSKPESYRKMLEIMGERADNVVFFDDNPYNLAAAREAGLETVGVFDDANEECIDRIKASCDTFIYNFSELL